ncbi:MAG: chemotaxis-specific protein-glutamate methyltransferase CheB [Lachnospiraceae bacterium]|nr:chemotaxis-specific protein-glutamate methyltransferase CheB [Lachnospiraceae bacterium]
MAKKILIVDDSALMRRVICDIIKSDNRFEVADIAMNGEEGLQKILTENYDAVVMDLVMPKMTGIDVLKQMQKSRNRTRILVLSSQTTEGAQITMEALELGAVDFMHKPSSIMGAQREEFAGEFLDRLYAVSISRFIPRPSVTRTAPAASPVTPQVVRPRAAGAPSDTIVAVASSTGGPKALQAMIPLLPENLAAPVLIVQHMPVGFTASLAARLDTQSKLHVVEAADGMPVETGNVYVAPGGLHMHVVQKGRGHVIRLLDGENREGVKPCANYMYESLGECGYNNVVCVVMTGMGADGTEGIANLKPLKKTYVITQEQSTCVVYGMPRAVVAKGLSDQVEPLENLASAITKQVGVK